MSVIAGALLLTSVYAGSRLLLCFYEEARAHTQVVLLLDLRRQILSSDSEADLLAGVTNVRDFSPHYVNPSTHLGLLVECVRSNVIQDIQDRLEATEWEAR